jgi:hypothetical protein
MVNMERLVGKYIFDPEISEGKMVFLSGPRQVGKTTFALNWLASMGAEGTYFNWDDPAVKTEYVRNPLYLENAVLSRFHGKPAPVVFDEIHKHKNGKNILKGIYDTTKDKMNLLVTGSARLGSYRKSDDSLIGRYFSFGKYFAKKIEIPFYQVSLHHTRVEAFPGKCFKVPASNFLLSVG